MFSRRIEAVSLPLTLVLVIEDEPAIVTLRRRELQTEGLELTRIIVLSWQAEVGDCVAALDAGATDLFWPGRSCSTNWWGVCALSYVERAGREGRCGGEDWRADQQDGV
jgi:hypothetical protein